ncbi:MAG: carboxy terminal-processing peptidase, partial [Arenimonas sp.]
MLKSKLIALTALIPLTLAIGAAPGTKSKPVQADAGMHPTADQAIAASYVYDVFSDSDLAYRPRPLNDELSTDIFRRYIDMLDSEKMYFTAADMKNFEGYKTTLDDAIKGHKLDPAFTIFETYQQRVDQRIAFARSLLKKPFDFSSQETWAYDRKDAAWAADANELNELWRKSVKNDALRLKLAGRTQEEIAKTLDKRYAQVVERNSELR